FNARLCIADRTCGPVESDRLHSSAPVEPERETLGCPGRQTRRAERQPGRKRRGRKGRGAQMIEGFENERPNLEVFRRNSLVVGASALALGLIGAFLNPQQFFRSYMLAFLFCTGVPLGCFAILMLQHMSGGVWGLVSRRVLESATRTFPLLALLFIPIIFGVHSIFPWDRGAGA